LRQLSARLIVFRYPGASLCCVSLSNRLPTVSRYLGRLDSSNRFVGFFFISPSTPLTSFPSISLSTPLCGHTPPKSILLLPTTDMFFPPKRTYARIAYSLPPNHAARPAICASEFQELVVALFYPRLNLFMGRLSSNSPLPLRPISLVVVDFRMTQIPPSFVYPFSSPCRLSGYSISESESFC